MRGKIRFVENGGPSSVLGSNCLNTVLTGNPGTGKTTVSRLMFRFLLAYGVLKKDVSVERNALELKGEYLGQTCPKVVGAVRSALGGCLFLDEAYALAGNDPFSSEAIRTLLTEVENNRTSVMVILAGYRDKMGELMRCDPGMPRRFPLKYHLEDYSPDELARIAEDRALNIFGLKLEEGVGAVLAEGFRTVYASEVSQHNGGLAVRVVEEAMGRFATRMDRLMQLSGSADGAKAACANRFLSVRDFNLEDRLETKKAAAAPTETKTSEAAGELSEAEVAARRAVEAEADTARKLREVEEEEVAREAERRVVLQEAAMAELEGMVGFEEAKRFVHKLVLKVKFVQAGGSRRVLDTCRNLVLTGNPGVGKTTFARLLHKVLFAFGVLREDTFVERNALQLKGEYIGQTSPKVSGAFAAAKGGTLFLDEAYALAGGGVGGRSDCFATDAIATLLTEAENHRTDVMVILAGYEGPMKRLLDADPGLRRRFPHTLSLPNYSFEELAQIVAKAAVERFEVTLAPGVQEQLAVLIRDRFAAEVPHHNASLPIRLVEEALTAMAERTMLTEGPADLSTLLYEDFIAK